jgi:sigma-B regulation protein RsbU (phosphoserine phosphatase)
MQRAPFPPNEEERLSALHSLRLKARAEERFDRVTRLAAELFHVPMAFVSFIDRDRQLFKAKIGLPVEETPREVSFCAHAILGEHALIIPDAHQDPRFADNPLVTGDPFLRAYMGQPLRAPGGAKIGTLCIADREPRDFTSEQVHVLGRLAELIEQELQMSDLIDAQSELLNTQRELLKTQQRLHDELSAAATYVRSLIPPPLDGPVSIDWRYLPSEELGGDCVGYHFLGTDKIALYVLDICGHGVDAALLSVVLLNVLRSRSLLGVDFADPSAVLGALNREFPVERHGKFFTIWYGVLDLPKQVLTFSTAGHPPGILVPAEGPPHLLSTDGIATGCLAGATYENVDRPLQSQDTLYLYSDGAYELRGAAQRTLELAELAELFAQATREPNPLDQILVELRRLGGSERFEDDVSLMAIRIH